jgi:starch synthase (maltosyl-transferring)
MHNHLSSRIVIENVLPKVDNGRFAIKRIIDEPITVTSDIFCDGHVVLNAEVVIKYKSGKLLATIPMIYSDNDNWYGTFSISIPGDYQYQLSAWIDTFSTWQRNFIKKYGAGQNVQSDVIEGADIISNAASRCPSDISSLLKEAAYDLVKSSSNKYESYLIATDKALTDLMKKYSEHSNLTYSENSYPLAINQRHALFSAWYEFFPRSFKINNNSVFRTLDLKLSQISSMGFDTVYLPPIHPIGITNRKGKNNSLVSETVDPGSPWAIGSHLGGHKSIDPELGTLEDFQRFIKSAEAHGMRVAIDLAFQCSPDHPYCRSNPEWFKFRPDGSIQFAENPPKKYEDIVPLNFDSTEADSLWKELLSIVIFWIDQGITVFRVDNPHTKPIPFWEWLISQVREQRGDIHFLSEAFTRPKVMYRLAKAGFTQSYTYFTWRSTKIEIENYIEELTKSNVSEYFRPNFWPNTPDILPEFLQHGGKQSFAIRFLLASLLSSNYGIYGPAFECCSNEGIPGKEEYINSEKYEIKQWEEQESDYLVQLISNVNNIRKKNQALQQTNNILLLPCTSDSVISFCKFTSDTSNVVIISINLDPFHRHVSTIDLTEVSKNIIDISKSYFEELNGGEHFFQTDNQLKLDMDKVLYPAFIFKVNVITTNEESFSYY